MTDMPRTKPLRRRAAGDSAGQLHHGQGARKADRDQPQRRHPPGSAGPAAAGRAAADQPESRGVPDDKADHGLQAGTACSPRRLRIGAAPAAAEPGCHRRCATGGRGRRAIRRLPWLRRNPSAEMRRQVGAVNLRRRTSISGSAPRRRGEVVGMATGCELLAGSLPANSTCSTTGPGESGWPGQPVPLPAHCGS